MGLEEPTPCLPGHQEGFPAHKCHPSGVAAAPVLPPPSQLPAPGRASGFPGQVGAHLPLSGQPPWGPWSLHPLPWETSLWNKDRPGESEALDRTLPCRCSCPLDTHAQPELLPALIWRQLRERPCP